jgi:hypothetical protein
MATKGTRWVVDRSRDLVPQLLGMAAVEWWYARRGLGYRLDAAAARETAAALAGLAGPAETGRVVAAAGTAPATLTRWPDLMDANPTSFDRSR